jgi:hypothetical protein
MRSHEATCSTSAPTPASRSRSPAKTATSSSSTAIEAVERTAPEKTAAEKMLGKAERMIILANDA